MAINWNDNKLTDDVRLILKQGTKVKFKWHGSNQEYIGRIEIDQRGVLYFVSEHNYKGDLLTNESMRFYNSLDSFFHFTSFEILSGSAKF